MIPVHRAGGQNAAIGYKDFRRSGSIQSVPRTAATIDGLRISNTVSGCSRPAKVRANSRVPT